MRKVLSRHYSSLAQIFAAEIAVACALFLLATLLIGGKPAEAATIELVDRPLCRVRLDGPIEKGDLEKMLKAVEDVEQRLASEAENGQGNAFSDWINVCLNSDGGDFSEGLRIIDHLKDNPDFGMAVDSGERCYSVCAFVFMAGRYNYFHELNLPVRHLHVRGTLGFQTPPFEPGKGAQDMAQVAAAYATGVRAISDLLEKSEGDNFWDRDRILPRALMLEILGREPDEALEVTTIEQAAKWQIQVAGFEPPAALTDEMLLRACLNEDRARHRHFRGDAKNARPSQAPIALRDGKYRHEFTGLGPKGDGSCVADAYRDSRRNWFISVAVNAPGEEPYVPDANFLEEQVTNGSDEARAGLPPGVPLWMVYPPETRLKDFPVAR